MHFLPLKVWYLIIYLYLCIGVRAEMLRYSLDLLKYFKLGSEDKRGKKMKTINKNTKTASRWISAYVRSRYSTLSQCYVNCSFAKRRAENECRSLMLADGGEDFRIISYNSMQFSCGWRLADGSLRIETASNSYLIPA